MKDSTQQVVIVTIRGALDKLPHDPDNIIY